MHSRTLWINNVWYGHDWWLISLSIFIPPFVCLLTSHLCVKVSFHCLYWLCLLFCAFCLISFVLGRHWLIFILLTSAELLSSSGHPYHTEGLTCLSLSSDSAVALSGSKDSSAHVVNITTGKVCVLIVLVKYFSVFCSTWINQDFMALYH